LSRAVRNKGPIPPVVDAAKPQRRFDANVRHLSRRRRARHATACRHGTLTPGHTMKTLLRRAGLAAALLIPGIAAAQETPGAIAGTVVSEATGQPIPAAAVTIRRMADSTVAGAVTTNQAGRFIQERLPLGSYRVEISSVGHATAGRADLSITAAAPRL